MITRKQAERLHAALLDILLVNFQVTDANVAEKLGSNNEFGGSRFNLTMNNGLSLEGVISSGIRHSARTYHPSCIYLRFNGDPDTIIGLGLSKHHLNQYSHKWNWHPSGENDDELIIMDRSIYNVIQRCGGIKSLILTER